METKVQKEIRQRLTRYRKGKFIFLSDFRGLGSEAAIRKAFSRLCIENKINRIAHGVYFIPETDPVLGTILPSMESVAEAIAKKERVRIKPAGAYALHKLGLTNQVPMKLVYLTDGPLRQIKIGKTIIKFKPTTPKKLSFRGKLSSLIIQALEELGTEGLGDNITNRIKDLLQAEDPKKLDADIKLAPVKISVFIIKLLKDSQ